jgi:uncharacterized phage protein (TIGR02218 family)
MKKVHVDVVDLLTGYQFVAAELYTVTLANGATYRWTSSDSHVEVLINTWVGVHERWELVPTMYIPMPLERGDITQSVGLSVDDVNVTLFCTDAPLFGDVTAQHFSLIGGFDNAHIKIELAFMDDAGVFMPNFVHLFEGSVTDVAMDRSKVDLTVSSVLIKLDTKVPRVVYQPSCTHSLYDVCCTLNSGDFEVFGVVGAGSSTRQICFNSASGYFDLGRITFTSGRNRGFSRSACYFNVFDTAVVVNVEFPFMPEVGDEFVIVPGCDKSRSTCRTKFNNEVHFLGWEYMPVPEASL